MDPHIINTKVQITGQNFQICKLELCMSETSCMHVWIYKALLLVLLLLLPPPQKKPQQTKVLRGREVWWDDAFNRTLCPLWCQPLLCHKAKATVKKWSELGMNFFSATEPQQKEALLYWTEFPLSVAFTHWWRETNSIHKASRTWWGTWMYYALLHYICSSVDKMPAITAATASSWAWAL